MIMDTKLFLKLIWKSSLKCVKESQNTPSPRTDWSWMKGIFSIYHPLSFHKVSIDDHRIPHRLLGTPGREGHGASEGRDDLYPFLRGGD